MKKKALSVLCALAVMLTCGCENTKPADTGSSSQTVNTDNIQSVTTAATEKTTTDTEASVPPDKNDGIKTDPAHEYAQKTIAEMTLEQKIAQMIMISLRTWEDKSDPDAGSVPTKELNDTQKKFLTKYDFGGVCLFGQNIAGTEQTVRLTAQIQQAALASETGIPMLISADQEGGYITRLGTGTITPGNMALGAVGDPDDVYTSAEIMGVELSALGINTDFAPVLDVNNNPANPVISVRSFSSDPVITRDLGAAFISGLMSTGVISTVKHFPGHGDTDVDSHTGLPMIDKTYSELKNFELIPFAQAVSAGADMFMTAHIQYPQIEKETYVSKSTGEKIYLPATLSKTIISDILRSDLGFDGVVVTDSLVMDAIAENFDPIDAAVLSINADMDILLEPMLITDDDGIVAAEEYVASLAKAVRDGRIAVAEIDDSVERILVLKYSHGLIYNELPDIDESISAALRVAGSEEHYEKALNIAEKAITLIKNDDNVFPLRPAENDMVAFFCPYDDEPNAMTFALDKLKAGGIISDSVTAESYCFMDRSASEFSDVAERSSAVILAVETYRRTNMDAASDRGWQAVFADEMIKLAHDKGKKVILLSMNLPYDIARYTEADAILCAYCSVGMPVLPEEYNGEMKAYGVNYPAAIITVFGGSTPTGRLPVDVPVLDSSTEYTDEILYPIGTRLE